MHDGLRAGVVAGGLCVAIIAATFPAWTGSWVYDDWLMHGNESMDGPEDLTAVFGRSSADYLGTNAATHAGAVTYRPLAMLSLIAVQAFAPDAPLAHHLVSLALHLVSVLLLFATLRALAGSQVASLGALTFGLHPLGVEAYGWINGRSDALAAFGIALLGWALFAGRGPKRIWIGAAAALLSALAKETAVLAVLGLALASLFPADPGQEPIGSPRERVLAALACAAALALALAARALLLADAGKTLGSFALMPDLLLGVVRLSGVAAGSVLVPAPRTMLNLGYRLAQPLSALEVALLLALVALVVWLAVRRRLRACALIVTAGLMVMPCLMVRHAFWHGCDRYLYVPLLLACLALGSRDFAGGLAALRAPLRQTGALVWLLALAISTFLTARTYHSQTDHMLGMMRLRPDDPTGYLIGAQWLWRAGQKEGAQQLINRTPRTDLPPPLASQLATRLGEMGRTREALDVVADMARRYPRDPYVRLDVVSVELDQRRIREAAASAELLRPYPTFCRAARALIAKHVQRPGWNESQRTHLRLLLDTYTCP